MITWDLRQKKWRAKVTKPTSIAVFCWPVCSTRWAFVVTPLIGWFTIICKGRSLCEKPNRMDWASNKRQIQNKRPTRCKPVCQFAKDGKLDLPRCKNEDAAIFTPSSRAPVHENGAQRLDLSQPLQWAKINKNRKTFTGRLVDRYAMPLIQCF